MPCLITVSHYPIKTTFADGRTSIFPTASQCFSHFPMTFPYAGFLKWGYPKSSILGGFVNIPSSYWLPPIYGKPQLGLTALGLQPGLRHSHHVGPNISLGCLFRGMTVGQPRITFCVFQMSLDHRNDISYYIVIYRYNFT